MTSTDDKALINIVIDAKKLQISKDDRRIALLKLKKKYSFAQLEKFLGVSDSTIEYWMKGNNTKKDATQKTNRLVKKEFDFDVLIRHFRCYIPRSPEEVIELQELCAVIMDCIKRR